VPVIKLVSATPDFVGAVEISVLRLRNHVFGKLFGDLSSGDVSGDFQPLNFQLIGTYHHLSEVRSVLWFFILFAKVLPFSLNQVNKRHLLALGLENSRQQATALYIM